MVISVKIRIFSRSRMTKRTSPLESSHKIKLPRRISLNSETVGISRFSRHRERCRTLGTFWVAKRRHVSSADAVKLELKWGSLVTHGMRPLEGNLIVVG